MFASSPINSVSFLQILLVIYHDFVNFFVKTLVFNKYDCLTNLYYTYQGIIYKQNVVLNVWEK